MKKLLLILCLLPVAGFAQKQADFENVVGNFVRYYNNYRPDGRQKDSILAQYADSWSDMKNRLWNDTLQNKLMNDYGKIRSYKFIELYKPPKPDGGGNGLAFFKIISEKSTHMMAITLDKDNKLLTFRFHTSSRHIDSLLKRN